jgi:hypothetical protein
MSKNQKIIASIIVIFLFSAIAIFAYTVQNPVNTKSKQNNLVDVRNNVKNVDSAPISSQIKEASSNKFTLAELAKHTSVDDCYVSFKKEVYDITTFLPKHLGGQRKPAKYCGKEIDSFSQMHPGGQFDEGKVLEVLRERVIGVLSE